MKATFLIQTSIAYDENMKRDPARDDWDVESVGNIPDDMIESFAANRYPKAIQVKVMPTEKAVELGLVLKTT